MSGYSNAEKSTSSVIKRRSALTDYLIRMPWPSGRTEKAFISQT